jgi:hypothetical protein
MRNEALMRMWMKNEILMRMWMIFLGDVWGVVKNQTDI